MPSWKGKSRGGAFGYRFFIGLIKRFGIRPAYFFLVFVVTHFIPFAPLATQSNWVYFRCICGYGWWKTIRMLYVNYYRFGQILIDKIAVRAGLGEQYRYRFEQYDEFLSVLQQPTGVILIGAHVGNWEVGSSFFGEYARKINIVMYDAEYRKIKEVLSEQLDASAYKIIPLSEDGFEHMYQIKDALDRHEYICFQGDRYVSEKTAQEISFMGKPAKFPTGPFQLAARYGVPVVFYFSMREKGMTYRFKFHIADLEKGKNARERADGLLKEYVGELEKVLREYPEQWFNYYRFWTRESKKGSERIS